MTIAARVVADSVSPESIRLLTFKVRYPWFIHGEVMTHRVLSRNASSNRAIPLKKMLEEARSDELRAEPVYWGAEQKGMEPGGELSRERTKSFPFGGKDYSPYEAARLMWREAAFNAAACAKAMSSQGTHKSLCNRLLMPFTHANVVVSATEWDNFFGLRLDKAADPTMRALTEAMWVAMQESEPTRKDPGDWHLPFADDSATWDDLEAYHGTEEHVGSDKGLDDYIDDLLIKVSVARCARVSYESFPTVLPDGTVVPGKRSTVEEDLKLYERLLGVQPMHASPAEHQATSDDREFGGGIDTGSGSWNWKNPNEHGNFRGWRQYRKTLEGEAVAPLPKEYAR